MHNRSSLVLPILIITVGCGWLLTVRGVIPGVDWVWTLGLAVIGILAVVVRGIDKLSVVIGPFFLLASVLSVLRQRDMLSVSHEVPILMIAFGVFLLIAQLPAIPWPDTRRSEQSESPAEHKKLRL